MIFGVGAAVAAFPPVMDFCVQLLGRKGAVVAGGAIFCVGSGLQAIACNMAMMLMGRVVAGFSVGLLSGNAPVYTSEIAPPKLRGALVTGFQFAITIGIMLAFLLALILQDVQKPFGGWRWVISAQILPGSLLVLGGILMPGSPRYLVAQGKPSEALKTLKVLRGEDVRQEFAEICQEHELESDASSWMEFLSGDNLKLLGIGVSIQLLQQICGMNAFMYDGPLIFEKLFGNAQSGMLFTLVSGVVNIFATIPGLFLVDRYGRTVLMKWSAAGMMACSAVLATIWPALGPALHRLVCWLGGWLAGWLAGLLVACLACWLAGWPAGLLACLLACLLAGWPAVLAGCWLACWLACLAGLLAGWLLACWLAGLLAGLACWLACWLAGLLAGWRLTILNSGLLPHTLYCAKPPRGKNKRR